MDDRQDSAPDLGSLRASIDRLDEQIIALLAERFTRTHAVGLAKAARGDTAIEPARRRQRTALLRDLAVRHAVDEGLVEDIYALIAREVVRNHERLGARPGGL